MKNITAYFEIIRPVNLFITFVTVILAAIICSEDGFNRTIILLAAFSAVLSAASGNVINDYFDAAIDKINRPDRPIPSGKISVRAASIYYLLLVTASLITAAFINVFAFVIVLFADNLLFIYSYKLKRIPLTGNVTVSFLTALTFIYGGFVAGNINSAFIPAIFAFFVNFIRELVKDIEDMKGDSINGIITFPSKYGIKSTKNLITAVTIVLIIFTTYPFFSEIYTIEFLLIVLFTVNLMLIYVVKKIFENDSQDNLKQASSMLKASMVFGLIAIYFGR